MRATTRYATMLAALGACVALAGCYNGHDLTPTEMNAANAGASGFANAADMTFVSCSGLDSEPDGYTTCTVRDKQSGQFSKIQCSYSASGAASPTDHSSLASLIASTTPSSGEPTS